MNVWEQKENETTKQYLAFTCYLSLGPGRTILKAEQLYKEKLGKPCIVPPTYPSKRLKLWSTQHDWVNRSFCYDAHIATIERETIEREFKESAKEFKQNLITATRQTLKNILAINEITEKAIANTNNEDIDLNMIVSLMNASGNVTNKIVSALKILYPDNFATTKKLIITDEDIANHTREKIKRQFPDKNPDDVMAQMKRIHQEIAKMMKEELNK
jgi:hypothetical protein